MRKIFASMICVSGMAFAQKPPVFMRSSCAADLSTIPNKTECGNLIVDETRGSPTSRRIAIPVVIIKGSRPRGLPPVVFLHGGPGGGIVGRLAAMMQQPGPKSWIGIDQDWILFDQRGGRLAAPSLDCGTLALNDAGLDNDSSSAALRACGQRWTAIGTDLSRYNAVEVAGDIEDLRSALGIKTFDVFGVSYGTRVALEVVRAKPAGLHAVIFDSFWPAEASWAEDGARPVSQAIRKIFALCRADASCNAANPNVEQRTDSLIRRWLDSPMVMNGHRFPVEDLALYLMDAAYYGPSARQIPFDLTHFANGDFTALAAFNETRSTYVEAQRMAHLCKERLPFEHRENTMRNAGADPIAIALSKSLIRYFDICQAFPVGTIDPRQNEPVKSDLPVLILDADIDPGCPPELAKQAVKNFAHGQLVIFPNATHSVAEGTVCAASIGQNFLRDVTAPVDTNCVASTYAVFGFPKE